MNQLNHVLRFAPAVATAPMRGNDLMGYRVFERDIRNGGITDGNFVFSPSGVGNVQTNQGGTLDNEISDVVSDDGLRSIHLSKRDSLMADRGHYFVTDQYSSYHGNSAAQNVTARRAMNALLPLKPLSALHNHHYAKVCIVKAK